MKESCRIRRSDSILAPRPAPRSGTVPASNQKTESPVRLAPGGGDAPSRVCSLTIEVEMCDSVQAAGRGRLSGYSFAAAWPRPRDKPGGVSHVPGSKPFVQPVAFSLHAPPSEPHPTPETPEASTARPPRPPPTVALERETLPLTRRGQPDPPSGAEEPRIAAFNLPGKLGAMGPWEFSQRGGSGCPESPESPESPWVQLWSTAATTRTAADGTLVISAAVVGRGWRRWRRRSVRSRSREGRCSWGRRRRGHSEAGVGHGSLRRRGRWIRRHPG